MPPEAAVRCLLNLSGNTVRPGAAPALVVLDTAPASAASLILTGNQLRSHLRPGASACLYLLRTCTAAANVIINGESEHRSAASLVVRPRRDEGWHQIRHYGQRPDRHGPPSRPARRTSRAGAPSNSVTPS